jgi:hypothetical protein
MRDTTPHEPTDETRQKVRTMYAVGITQADLSKFLGIDEKTLRKHYRDILDTALTDSNAQIGGSLFSKAKSGDTSAIIWWEKTRAGKSDKSAIDIAHLDKDREPTDMKQQVLGVLTTEQLNEFKRADKRNND